MYDPVALHITRAYPQAAVTRRAPFVPSHRLAYARHSRYWQHPLFDLLWQAHNAHDAYVSVLEIRSSRPLHLPFSCLRADIHWIYLLDGEATLRTTPPSDAFMPLQLQPSEYAVCYAAPAEYELHVASGTTRIIHCCVKAGWLLHDDESTYATPFQPLLRALRRQSRCCLHMAILPISPTVQGKLLALASVPMADHRLAVDTQVYAHVSDLVHLSQEALPHAHDDKEAELLQAVRRYLREQVALGNAPRIQEVADAFGVSQQHLNHLHRTKYGHSLKPYITRIRMEMALQLLRDGYTPTDVAYRLNYADPATFSNQFKAYYGFPPGQAR